jgi:hypothetical protein
MLYVGRRNEKHAEAKTCVLRDFAHFRCKSAKERGKEERQKEPDSEKIKFKKFLCLTDETLCHEDVWGSGCIDPRIHFGSSCRQLVSFPSRPLYPRGNSPWYQLARRLGGPQNWTG